MRSPKRFRASAMSYVEIRYLPDFITLSLAFDSILFDGLRPDLGSGGASVVPRNKVRDRWRSLQSEQSMRRRPAKNPS